MDPCDVGMALLAAAATGAGFPAPVREHCFHATRQWRFDLAFPGLKVAFEREGFGPRGTPGRHQRAAGYARDAEKYNEAALLGWVVIRATGRQIESGLAADWLIRALSLRSNPTGAPCPS